MLGLNNVQIIGNLGGTPEMKFLNNNDHVVNFSVAVNERWKNRDGEPQERTTWHGAACNWPRPFAVSGGNTIMSTPITAAAGGFFVQLMPLLTDRTLMVIVSKSDDRHLTLSVVPKRMKEGENAALTAPLCCTGTAEELDRDLPTHLRDFVSGHVTLS